MASPFFEVKYQDLQDIAQEQLGRNLTSSEIDRAKWVLFDKTTDLLADVVLVLENIAKSKPKKSGESNE